MVQVGVDRTLDEGGVERVGLRLGLGLRLRG